MDINCRPGPELHLDQMDVLQGNLKDLSKDSFDKFHKQMKKNGFVSPFHVWRTEIAGGTLKYYIVDGTQRHRMLTELEITERIDRSKYPTIMVEAKNIVQAKEIVLALTSQYGNMTRDGLYEFMNGADLSFDDMDDFRFPEIDMDGFKAEFFEPEIVDSEKDDEVPELTHDPITKRGDVWILGNHRVMCGDSTMIDDVDKLMDGHKADMVFTDPPYGVNAVSRDGKVGGGTRQAPAKTYRAVIGDENTDVARDACTLLLSLKIEKYIIWGGNYFTGFLDPSPCWIVWDKERPEGLTFADGEVAWTNMASPLKFIRHRWDGYHRASERDQQRVHPTQKPAYLAEWCFKQYKAGNNIIDLFLGSGSTLIACEKTTRVCYGMELDEHYCDVIINRWQEYTGKQAVLELTGESYNSLKSNRITLVKE